MQHYPKHYCGVFGIYGHPNAAQLTYYGLYALQHRGQESAGIVTSDGKKFCEHKGMGLVSQIFNSEVLNNLPGHMAVGHTRYSTTGSSHIRNAQPLTGNCRLGQIAIALVPGLAAREVAVGALGTVYALSASGDAVAEQLSPLIQHTWSLPTACALLAWYVFAPQCVATLSVTRRETGGWRQPIIMATYLFVLAYVAAGLTFYGVRYFFGA